MLKTLRALAAAVIVISSLGIAGADSHEPEMTSLFVTSFDGTQIDINVCRPAQATAENPVPVVLQSHGWGGAKSNCLGRTNFFDAGIGFASMTQRGNGGSGGENNVMDPDLEGRDIMAVIDHLASLEWVLKDDGPGGVDPVLGGLGGSYGGGFQWIGAFTDQHLRGAPTRFNTLHPGNTWYDLRRALAPNDVMRTVIVGGLYAAGVRQNRLAPWIHAAMASSIATGLVVDGPAPADFGAELHQHSAAWFVERGEQLDIPVFISQGAGDLVFNLNDGIDAFEQALTPAARARSIFVNHQGGHGASQFMGVEIPHGPVPYTPFSDDTCNDPDPLVWFRHTLLDEPLDDLPALRLYPVDGGCVLLDAFPAPSAMPVPALDGAALPVGVRDVVRFEPLASGALTLAGAPTLSFTATTPHPDARVFWGLAVGTSPEDARLIGGQWMPSRVGPAVAGYVDLELGAVVVEIDEGETVYLVASSSSDQYVAHQSRAPGVMLVDDVVVGLPVVS